MRSGLILSVWVLVALRCWAAEQAREWLTNEELGKQIFEREVVLPADSRPKMIEALDRFGDPQRRSFGELKTKLANDSARLTIMDVAGVASIEKKELAWLYDLLATNRDPVVQFFGLVPKVMILKDRSAATGLYDLAHPKSPNKEQWLVDNCLHGIGIDLKKDTADSIFEFISTMRDQTHPPIGSVARDCEIRALDGRTLRLSDFKGKPVLLHFWSTTCGPCLAEFPELDKQLKVWKKSHPELVVLGISLDDDLKALNRFLKAQDLQWIPACDQHGWGGEAAKAFHITGIPTDVLIDRDGKVFDYNRPQVDALLSGQQK